MIKAVFIFILIRELALGYINIYPSFFYEKISEKGVFKIFVLTNRSNQKVKYRLYLEENILSDVNIEVYPKSIILKPFEKGEVKVLLKSKIKNIDKEFSEKLIIKEVEIPGQKKRIMTILKLKLSGFIGNLAPKLNIEENLKEQSLMIKNIGQRVGIYEAYNFKDEYVDTFILKKGEKKELKSKEKLIFKERFETKNKG